ncbi:MAG TPA: hypothetical protein VGG39_33425 [Polyangiaceae bacterium]|jgi:hypothetical protein
MSRWAPRAAPLGAAFALLAASLARGVAGLLGATASCAPSLPPENWTCDFDASESRPLSDADAAVAPDGALPSDVCRTTCGPPASACSFTTLDGGVPGAVCPVCTF